MRSRAPVLGAGADLDFGLLEVLGVGLDRAGLEPVDDDQRGLVEQFTAVGKIAAEALEFTARGTPAHAQDHAAFGQAESSIATFSTTRTGSFHGRMTAAGISLIVLVFAAT